MSVAHGGALPAAAIDQAVTRLGYSIASVGRPKATSGDEDEHAEPIEGPWWQSRWARLTLLCGAALATAYVIGQVFPFLGNLAFVVALAVGLIPIACRAITVAAIGALIIGATEEAATVVLLFLVGELLEGGATRRARASIPSLTDLAPTESASTDQNRELQSMCFSAAASLAAAAILAPAGVLGVHRAYRVDRRYLALATLPLLFSMQQLLEGLVWIAGRTAEPEVLTRLSLAYMFFAWVAWPVWVPVSCFFVERGRRKNMYLAFAVAGGMLGALQYVPYFAHEGWLTTTFLDYAISYGGTELLDLIVSREVTYGIYVTVVIAPLLLSSDREIRVFGALVTAVLLATYFFFSYAYVSVFCFGGAVMSLYLVIIMLRKRPPRSALSTRATT